MIFKPTKSKVGNFFMYYGWLVIIASVISFSVYTLVISAINRIKENEKFSIFFAAFGLKEERYKNELLSYLKDDGVVQVNYYSYNYTDSNIGDYYTAYGYSSEINILSESDLNEMGAGIKDTFILIDENVKNELQLNEKYAGYAYENEQFAIKIFDKDNDSYNEQYRYTEWINFTSDSVEKENYYLLLSKFAPTYGEYSRVSVADYALKGVRCFLNENEK